MSGFSLGLLYTLMNKDPESKPLCERYMEYRLEMYEICKKNGGDNVKCSYWLDSIAPHQCQDWTDGKIEEKIDRK